MFPGFKLMGKEYHAGDVVLVQPTSNGKEYQVGIIVKCFQDEVLDCKVAINYLCRWSDVIRDVPEELRKKLKKPTLEDVHIKYYLLLTRWIV